MHLASITEFLVVLKPGNISRVRFPNVNLVQNIATLLFHLIQLFPADNGASSYC